MSAPDRRSRGRLDRTLRRGVKVLALAGVLALTLVVVPDSAVSPAQSVLVKIKQAGAVDTTPNVIWIMAIGSDARPGQDMTHERGDALQLVGIDSQTGAATAIGIPRDSWVDIPGHGFDKINSALYFGGPTGMAGAVSSLVGITPDYIMVTNFTGLKSMVDGIGGITVDNPIAFSDSVIKPLGYPAGKIKLTGYGALSFSRIRHDLIRGDFDRSANQERVLVGIQHQIAQRARHPGFIEKGVASVIKNMDTVDVSPIDLFRIAQAIAQVKPAKITHCVVQGGIGVSSGGASIVLPDRAMAERFGDEARNTATISHC